MFLAMVADGKTAAHGEKGRKTAKAQPEPASGWDLIGWALGPSLITGVSRALP